MVNVLHVSLLSTSSFAVSSLLRLPPADQSRALAAYGIAPLFGIYRIDIGTLKKDGIMATFAEKQILRARLEKFEGKVNHLYLDSKGLVTVGVGHLIRSVAGAQKLAFKTTKGLPASAAEIKADYDAVKKQPANRVTSFYKKHTKLTLPNTEIDKLTTKHVDSFENELKLIYGGFGTFPSEVKLALFDLIFNLGMTNLKNKWPIFNAAIKAKEWQKAADNAKRAHPISDERNRYVKELLEKAARNSKAKFATS